MSFFKNTLNILTNKRDISEPNIYKDIPENSKTVHHLTELANSNNPTINKKKVEQHIKLFSIGHDGEKSVLFELQHSMLPIVVLHDINLEIDNYKAQLDFVIITHKFILILEVKKLFGDIQVTNKGEFIRIIKKNNRVVNKEGMYSPINQVERHVAVLEHFLKTNKIIKKCPIHYGVTFANPKTILDISKQAPEHIQSNVIRHDQIKSFLTKQLEKDSPVFMLDKELFNIADIIVKNNKEVTFDPSYYSLENNASTIIETKVVFPQETSVPRINLNNLETDLKAYRLHKSRQLDMKPFHIFTNITLDAIIEKMPQTPDDLLKVTGIGPKKATEYGKDILSIIKKHQSL